MQKMKMMRPKRQWTKRAEDEMGNEEEDELELEENRIIDSNEAVGVDLGAVSAFTVLQTPVVPVLAPPNARVLHVQPVQAVQAVQPSQVLTAPGPEDDGSRRRSKRKRDRNTIEAFSQCLCGESVASEDMADPRKALKCKKAGCETVWVREEMSSCRLMPLTVIKPVPHDVRRA